MTMSTLEEAVRSWREKPFPSGSTVDALDEVHADLALYDAWVAESVIPYLDRGVWVPAVPDVLGALDTLTGEIGNLLDAGAGDSDAASRYVAYAGLLRDVYAAFLQEHQP